MHVVCKNLELISVVLREFIFKVIVLICLLSTYCQVLLLY
jgi:hypothetical protein